MEVGTWDWLRDLLRNVGLEDLYDQARNGVRQGSSDAEVFEVLRETPQYRSRFSAIFDREARGLAPISAGMIIEQERQLSTLFSMYGYELNPGQSIRDVANATMANDVSVNEMSSRLTSYRDFADRVAADPENAEVVAEMLGAGYSQMDLARVVLEPESLPEIESRLRTASIALEANRSGFGLNADEAGNLAARGLTGDQAEAGFGELARNRQVVNGLPGEEGGLSRQQQLAAVAGDAAALEAVEVQRRRRRAAFEGGGSFARDDEGFAGLA